MKIAFFYTSNVVYNSNNQHQVGFHQYKALRLAQQLIARGHSVYWLMPALKSQKAITTAEGIKIVTFDYPKIKGLSTLLYFIRVWEFLLSQHINCIHVHSWFFFRTKLFSALLFQIGVKTLGIRFLYDIGDLLVEFEIATRRINPGGLREKYLRFLSRLIYLFSDGIFVNSEESRDHLIETGIQREKIHVVVLGADEVLFNLSISGQEIRKKFGITDRFVVGWFGDMGTFRRIDEILIPLIENLSRDIPEVYFLIGGSGRMLNRFLLLREKRPDLPFRYVGYISYSCLPSYLAAVDVQVSPLNSEYEHCQLALSYKTIDALAVGKPSIITATRAHIRHFSRFKSLILAEDSYESFRSSLLKVKQNPELYKLLAERDAQMLDQYLLKPNIDRVAQIFELYNQKA